MLTIFRLIDENKNHQGGVKDFQREEREVRFYNDPDLREFNM